MTVVQASRWKEMLVDSSRGDTLFQSSITVTLGYHVNTPQATGLLLVLVGNAACCLSVPVKRHLGANPKRFMDRVKCYQGLLIIHYEGRGWGPNAECLDVNRYLLIPQTSKVLRFNLLYPLIMCISEASHN